MYAEEQSLFILKQLQKEVMTERMHYDFLNTMIRQPYIKQPITMDAVHDLFIYFYFEETPVLDSEKALMFLLRHFVVDFTMKYKNFERIRLHTINQVIPAYVASVLTINAYLDVYEEIRPQLSEEELHVFMKFADESLSLFLLDPERYPRQLVQTETKILQLMRERIQQQTQFNEEVEHIIRFIQQYTFDAYRLFDALK